MLIVTIDNTIKNKHIKFETNRFTNECAIEGKLKVRERKEKKHILGPFLTFLPRYRVEKSHVLAGYIELFLVKNTLIHEILITGRAKTLIVSRRFYQWFPIVLEDRLYVERWIKVRFHYTLILSITKLLMYVITKCDEYIIMTILKHNQLDVILQLSYLLLGEVAI